MSSNSIVLNTGQQMIINTDLSKIFVWNNRYESGTYTNATYDTVALAAGTVMGRVSATGKLKPLASAAVDGSQYPVGVLADDYSVEEGEDQELAVCVAGDVDQNKLVFDGADTLSTVIDGRQLRDRIAGDTVGIKLVGGEPMTAYDNQ